MAAVLVFYVGHQPCNNQTALQLLVQALWSIYNYIQNVLCKAAVIHSVAHDLSADTEMIVLLLFDSL